MLFFNRHMATPPSSHPPLPPLELVAPSPSTSKKTRKSTQLRPLATRLVGEEKPMVHVDHVTGKANGPHRKKLRMYLVIVTRDKVDVTNDCHTLISSGSTCGRFSNLVCSLQNPRNKHCCIIRKVSQPSESQNKHHCIIRNVSQHFGRKIGVVA